MSSGTPSNPSVVSFVKYIRPDLDLEEIEHFVNERQGQGDVYEEALNIGKWQTVERPKKRETDVNDMQNQKRGKNGRRNAGNQNQTGGTSRNRQSRRRGLKWKSKPNRRDGGASRGSFRNSHRNRERRSDRRMKGSRPLALSLPPNDKINSPASAPTSSPVVKGWGGVKTFADCLRPTPPNDNLQPSTQEALSINIREPPSEVSGEAYGTPRSSPTRGGTEEPTPQPTATAASTSQTAPTAMSSFSKASEEEWDEAEHGGLPPNPLLYDPVSDFRTFAEPTTPGSSCEDYEIPEKCSPVHTPTIVHETPQFPYTVQSPHKDHRIMDPAQVLREFGASQILAKPQRTERPPGISTDSTRKEQGSKNHRLKEPSMQTSPADFKIGLPQNFVATPQQLEDLRNSFMSAASVRESSERTARNVMPNRVDYNQGHNKHLDGFNNGRLRNLTTTTNQQFLYHSRLRAQRHVTAKHTQESIRPVVHLEGNCYGESFPLQNSLSSRVLTHLEENNKKFLLNPHQYTSVSTSYPMSMNSTTIPEINNYNLDPNAVSWPGIEGWASHCAQPSYHLSQSFDRESMGYGVEPSLYGKHNLAHAGSMIPSDAYLRKLWGVTPGETQLPYAPSPNSNNMSAFWTNPSPHSQIKEQVLSQSGYPFYNSVN